MRLINWSLCSWYAKQKVVPIEVQRLVFTTDLARRYKEFGHIGVDTPFYLIHLDMGLFLQPSLLAKYEKSLKFIKQRQNGKEEQDGPILAEELELMEKMAVENQRHLAGAEKLFSEEDFVHNYEEHYPDLAEETQQAYRGDLWRISGDFDVPKFVRSKKPKAKKVEEPPGKQAQPVDNAETDQQPEPVTFVPAPLVVVKKVKGKNKRHR